MQNNEYRFEFDGYIIFRFSLKTLRLISIAFICPQQLSINAKQLSAKK